MHRGELYHGHNFERNLESEVGIKRPIGIRIEYESEVRPIGFRIESE